MVVFLKTISKQYIALFCIVLFIIINRDFVQAQERLEELPIYISPYPVLSSTGKVYIPPENYNKNIYRFWKIKIPIIYAWKKWKDLDFILMIQEESWWNELFLWDNWASIWYCQFNKYYSENEYNHYIALNNWRLRIIFCYEHYQKTKDVVWDEFHGWNNRERNLPDFSFR